MQIKKDYTKMIEQFEKMEKDKQNPGGNAGAATKTATP